MKDEQILLNEIDSAIAVPEEFGCNEAEYREFTGKGPVLSLPKLYGYNIDPRIAVVKMEV